MSVVQLPVKISCGYPIVALVPIQAVQNHFICLTKTRDALGLDSHTDHTSK